MMKFQNKILKYKFYREIIISFIILVTITVFSLSGILFSLFSSSTTRQIDANFGSMLSQVSYASDIIYNQVLNISNQLNTDNEINRYLYSSIDDDDTAKVVNYDIYLKLSRMQSGCPYIYSIGVYNAQNRINIDTKGIEIDKNNINLNSKKYLFYYPRKASVVGSNNTHSLELLTFILYPDYSLQSSSRSAIIINVDQAYITNIIKGINHSMQDSNIFVMDSNGQVLSHTNPSLFMEDFSKKSYTSKILSGNKAEGSFIEKIDNEKQLVTYVKSSELNWYFVSVMPYKAIIHDINKLKDITAITALCLLLFGIIISMILSGFIYNPMKSLMNKINNNNGSDILPEKSKLDEYEIITEVFSKSQELEKSAKSAIKEHYLLNLISGGSNEIEAPDEIIKSIERGLSGPYFCCSLLKIDGFSKLKDTYDAKKLSLVKSSICSISLRQFEGCISIDAVITDEDEIVLLIQLGKDVLEKEIPDTFREIQSIVKKQFNLTISVSIGDIVYSKNDIYISYKSSLEYIKYRLFYGYGCIVDSESLKAHFKDSAKYPVSVEKKIAELIQSGHKSLLEGYINDFIALISSSSYYQVINYCNQFITDVFIHFENSVDLSNHHIDAIGGINNSETLEDISQIMLNFCLKIVSLIDEKNSNVAVQKYRIIIEKVQNYIKDNYNNQNLSLEFVSGIVGLSPGYLGKLFKSITNMSFNEYLNSVRLERAKILLSTTSQPASKICEEVGIYNVSYFSTLFKKYTGLTPSQYREQVSISDN